MLRFSVTLLLAAALALAAPLAVLRLADAPTASAPVDRVALAASTPARNTFGQFTTAAHWRAGKLRGVTADHGTLRIGTPVKQRRSHQRLFDESRWTSPWVTPGHAFTLLNPSWNARTPGRTWLTVRVKVRSTGGAVSTWQGLGQWAAGERAIRRTSLGPQTDALSTVAVDTLTARPGVSLTAYRLQVRLLRPAGHAGTPRIRSVAAVASQPASALPSVSKPMLPAKTLPVPAYSQMIHLGSYARYGGGGEAWCSPTALAMLLGYYRALPAAADYSWVRRGQPDPFVVEVARRVFDQRYDGTGNWPFNTAYAATRVKHAVVTRLGTLRDAERFIAAGIPLEASISFGRGQLTGAPISSTAGHLVVIVGFTGRGDVVVNDPAASTNAGVRRVYDRAQFEAAWLRSSRGLVYAAKAKGHPWPKGYLAPAV